MDVMDWHNLSSGHGEREREQVSEEKGEQERANKMSKKQRNYVWQVAAVPTSSPSYIFSVVAAELPINIRLLIAYTLATPNREEKRTGGVSSG